MRRRVKAPPEWLTPDQVADKLNVDPKTVVRWALSGAIPAEHVRRTPTAPGGGYGHRRIRAAWVSEWLNGDDGSKP